MRKFFKIYLVNIELFLESYRGDGMRYGQDYDRYICDDRDTAEYVQMIREMSDEEFERFLEELKEKPELEAASQELQALFR